MDTSVPIRACSVLVLALASLAAHADLLTDGGFESSGTGTISPLNAANWTSDVPYFIDASNRYDIVNGATPNSVNSGWRSDLLAEEGTHYLLVDGPTSSGEAVLTSTQVIAVTAVSTYTLSAFLAAVDVNSEPIPNLTLQVSFFNTQGNLVNQLQSQLTTPSIAAGWQSIALSGVAGGGSVRAQISISDTNTSAFGNDFALDGLGFAAQPVPEPGTWAALGFGAVAFLKRRKR